MRNAVRAVNMNKVLPSELHTQPLVSVYTVGRLRLITRGGADITPEKSAKAQGIVALLLLAPGMERSREYLIDKLWSDRQAEQGARSLKTELHTIRSAFGDYKDLLISKRGMVTLRPDAFVRDTDAPDFVPHPDQELFEGLTVRDPEFVDWLAEQRRAFEATGGQGAKPRLILNHTTTDAPLHQSVLSGGYQQTLADWCAEQLVVGQSDDANFADEEADPNTFLLEQVVASGTRDVASSMSMIQLKDRRLLWHRIDNMSLDPSAFMSDPQTYRAINANVDKTLYGIAPPGGTSREARYLERGAIGAIRLIFRNQQDDIELARKRLSSNFEAQRSGTYLAWMAYALTYLKGERRENQAELRDEAEALARQALEIDPHNSMVLALTSYVYTYLMGNPQQGLQLAEKATDINRSNPLGWAFRGVAMYTMGAFEEAYQLTQFARAISGDGPYRYAVETYFCIAATLTNNLDEAIAAGEAACRMKPDFHASLRYLAVLYAHKKDSARLTQIITELRRREPDFSLEKMLQQSNYPSEILRTAPLLSPGTKD